MKVALCWGEITPPARFVGKWVLNCAQCIFLWRAGVWRACEKKTIRHIFNEDFCDCI